MDVLSAGWAFVSAVAVVLLGAVTLSGGAGRPRGAFAFGLFAIVWGLEVVFGNAARIVTDASVASTLLLFFLACHLVTPYFLIESASAQVESGRRRWLLLRTLAVVVALVGAIVLNVFREAVLIDVVFDGRIRATWGPLYVPLFIVPQFTAFGIALLALHRAKTRAPTPRTAIQMATLLGGLGVYVAFAAANNLAFYGGYLLTGPDASTPLLAALFLGLTLIAAHVGIEALRAASRSHGIDRAREKTVALALLVPLAWGAVEGFYVFHAQSRLETVGLWRLAGVAVIAYGFARWRIYDLPQRVASGAATTGGAVAAVAGGATTYGVASLAATGVAFPAVAAVVVTSAALLPSIRFMRRLVGGGKGAGPDVEEKLYGQRIETYRAALESSLARGTLAEDEEFLAALRERFGISADEDRVLRYYAKSSVLVPRAEKGGLAAYERLRLLGEGGSGRTWLARDRARDRLVVLKEPLERWQRELALKDAVLREARLAAKVRHPNVVAIEEVVEHDGHPVIVMEYLDGGTLADLLAGRGTLGWKEAAGVMMDVMRGLDAVHNAGIVHRDVKPSNILLTQDGTPKLGDFGVALVPSGRKTVIDIQGPFGSGKASPADGDTLNTVRAGTPMYMAPEVREGATLGDRRADVYACAAVLHECLYGTPPVPGAAVVVRDDVPPALASALARGLSAKPEARFPTARAFAEELAKVVRS